MYYKLKINDKIILIKDCLYRLHNDQLHEVNIMGVFYGSEDYETLKELLNTPITIQLVWEEEVFAELRQVTLDDVEYHLIEDDVNFYGTFKDYAEDTEKLEETR